MKQALYDQRQNITFIFLFAAIIWLAIMSGGTHDRYEFEVPEVELSEAEALINSGAIIIDVRGEKQFDHRHITGAMLIPLAILRAGIPEVLSLEKDKSIVVYCNKGRSKGPEATHILQKAGFSKVVNIKSGIGGWDAAGLPVTRK